MRILFLFIFYCFFIENNITAQAFPRADFPLKNVDGTPFKMPWAGGLNSPQFSEADLDNDGTQDLVIFDRTGNRVLTFLNGGASGQIDYVFAPQFIENFPKELRSWALLRDFNKDGAADIFCSSPTFNAGVNVYRGFYENNLLKFKPINFTQGSLPILYYQSLSGSYLNIVITSEDLPEFVDVNGDGDLDLLTFDPGGGFVDYFENQSKEKNLGLDTFLIKHLDGCWMDFYESGLTKASKLSGTTDTCAYGFKGPDLVEDRGGLHAGSTLCAFDQDGDGDLELVTGDIAFENMVFYKNCGTKTNAWACEQDSMYPIYDEPVDLIFFPSGFHIDLNNDGRRDFLAAPNIGFAGDDIDCAWRFNNVGTGVNQLFALEERDFLGKEMFDGGTGAAPVFFDVNADGLMDLIVGNHGTYKGQGNWQPRLFYFKNIGTQTAPAFILADSDWLNFSQYSVGPDTGLAPAFGDIDGDGDIDLIVGSESGYFFFVRNKTQEYGEPLLFDPIEQAWLGLYGGTGTVPAVIDMNGDGKNDIIAGRRNGTIIYFENTGTVSQPAFTQKNNKLGDVSLLPGPAYDSYNSPTVVNFTNGTTELFIGEGQKGRVLRFSNVVGNVAPGGVFTKISDNFGNLREGYRVHPALADINKDGLLEMVVGNLSGGLSFFSTNISKTDGSSVVDTAQPPANLGIGIWPNPTGEQFTVRIPEGGASWRAFNVLGQKMGEGQFFLTENPLNVASWASGFYFLEIKNASGSEVKKVQVSH